MNRYVPQSVMTPEGEILDIHIVLNEMFKSGDKLFVEYSDGPTAYKARSASQCQQDLLLCLALHLHHCQPWSVHDVQNVLQLLPLCKVL